MYILDTPSSYMRGDIYPIIVQASLELEQERTRALEQEVRRLLESVLDAVRRRKSAEYSWVDE